MSDEVDTKDAPPPSTSKCTVEDMLGSNLEECVKAPQSVFALISIQELSKQLPRTLLAMSYRESMDHDMVFATPRRNCSSCESPVQRTRRGHYRDVGGNGRTSFPHLQKQADAIASIGVSDSSVEAKTIGRAHLLELARLGIPNPILTPMLNHLVRRCPGTSMPRLTSLVSARSRTVF